MFTIFSRHQSESESQRQSTEGGKERAVCAKALQKVPAQFTRACKLGISGEKLQQLTHIETFKRVIIRSLFPKRFNFPPAFLVAAFSIRQRMLWTIFFLVIW